MKIENSFTVDAPVEEAWALLTNIPEIAPCLPGAKLSGEEDGVYKGSVKVKVGPVTAEYRGTAEFIEKDDAAHKAVINGKGRDSRGAGNAQAHITAEMQQVGEQTHVDIITHLKISGKVAQFGRGVMQDVSEKLLGQFAECLAGKLGDADSVEEIAAAGAAHVASATGSDTPPEVPAGAKASTATAPTATATATSEEHDEHPVLDLLEHVGPAAAKRATPAAIALLLLIVWWLRRR